MQSSAHITVFAALWLALASQKAGAVVVFVDIVPDFLVNYANPIYDLDMNGDGIRDLRIASEIAAYHGFEAYADAHARIQDIQIGGPTSYDIWPVYPGQVVGAAPLGSASWRQAADGSLFTFAIESSTYGFFTGITAYMGVELTLADGIHYGVVHIRGGLNVGRVLDYAWETEPGVPITAPEPSRLLLVLLGMSAWVFRRRRALGSG